MSSDIYFKITFFEESSKEKNNTQQNRNPLYVIYIFKMLLVLINDNMLLC
jgi:hypothetical protein